MPVGELRDLLREPTRVPYEKDKDSLVTKDKYGCGRGFAVAGNDNKFYWAKAYIKNKTVVLTCEKVGHPVAVRYAW